ncbi:MAG: hypothetical protein QXS42_02235 [Zestosphaera sp.]
MASSLSELSRVAYVASYTTLAIILRFFELPFPPAPFLKYDIAGVPLALLAFNSLRSSLIALPAFFLVSVILGADPVGMIMKVTAEVATYVPLVILYRRFSSRSIGPATALSVGVATASRTLAMCLLNLLVTPYWLMMAYPNYFTSFEIAWSYTLYYLPWITVFNASLAVAVALLSISTYRVLRRMSR